MSPEDVVDVLSQNITDRLFPLKRQLLPSLSDVYELELAFHESLSLSDEELLRNGAYFLRISGKPTRHFLMCTGESLKLPAYSSSELKSFFEKNLFRTGYATHGLFPYKGKFHPQMIKGLINIMGLKPGDSVLDPMAGSGTVPVEACLMGINSIGIDASPFCRFMAQTKVDALTMSLSRTQKAFKNYKEVFFYFQKQVGNPKQGSKHRKREKGFMGVMEPSAEYVSLKTRDNLPMADRDRSDTYNFLLLAYLDSAGYSERSGRRSPLDQFKAVLERYVFVAEKIQKVLKGMESELGTTEILEGDARSLPLADECMDGIIFSPPYSFAIDYLKNDSFHLNFLGAETDTLREIMVGLRGQKLSEKFELYKEDVGKILSECARVLRKGRMCTILTGTNDNQLSKVLGVPPEEVQGLHKMILQMGIPFGLELAKMMSRPIRGISNTMRLEYILMFQKK